MPLISPGSRWQNLTFTLTWTYSFFTAWKVSVLGVNLIPIFPHSDWITPNTDTFYAVFTESKFYFSALQYAVHYPLNIWTTAQKMAFSIKDFFSKYDQSRRKLRIWSHLRQNSLMENAIFCAVDFLVAAHWFKKPVSINFVNYWKLQEILNYQCKFFSYS